MRACVPTLKRTRVIKLTDMMLGICKIFAMRALITMHMRMSVGMRAHTRTSIRADISMSTQMRKRARRRAHS